jgi:hypothetical protein
MVKTDKMLTVGIQHLCLSTQNMLEQESLIDSNIPGYSSDYNCTLMITVGRYGDFAWLMSVPAGDPMDVEGMPADLCHIMRYAKEQECGCLLIDVDAEPNPDLPVYPWE